MYIFMQCFYNKYIGILCIYMCYVLLFVVHIFINDNVYFKIYILFGLVLLYLLQNICKLNINKPIINLIIILLNTL